MKIKFEKKVKNCNDCPLFFLDFENGEEYFCYEDDVYQDNHAEKLPCEIRPCPLEVKE